MPPIYVSKDGQRHGPYSLKQLDQLLQTETFTGDDLYWQEGAADWRPISQLPGFVPPPAEPLTLPRPSYDAPAASDSPAASGVTEQGTTKAAAPAPPAPVTADVSAKKVKDDYVKYIRSTSTYPTFRSLVGIFVLLIYLVGALWILGGVVAGVAAIVNGETAGILRGIGLLCGGVIGGLIYIVIGKVLKETSLMLVDIADTLLHHHSQRRE